MATTPMPEDIEALSRLDRFLTRLSERLSPAVVEHAVVRRSASILANRRTSGGRSAVIKKCKWCKQPFNATEMMIHRGRCPKRPKRHGGGRPIVPRPCKYCHEEFPTADLRVHEPKCPKRPAVAVAA